MNNPFFEKYETPRGTIPFTRIKLEHYEEAILEGIKRDDEEIELITNNPEEPTFDNTLLFYDESKPKHYYNLLDRAETVMSCMMSCETCDELEELAQKLSPALTKHENDVSLNPKLFERIKCVWTKWKEGRLERELSAEESKLLDDSYKGFVRSGALLSDGDKEKLRELTEEMALLTLQFSQNLLKERKAYTLHITDEAEVEGLPESLLNLARNEAKERELEGYIFTLDGPSYGPFMQYCAKRELREQMYMAYNTLAIESNKGICARIINLRREVAQLLGYKTYADYVLEYRMASNTENVYKLLDDLIEAYKPTAERERQELKDFAGGEIKQWDSAYYSHKLKMERYNIDAEMLRPYLKLENVITGVFGLATRLYGISFKENPEIEVYHPDVKAYEVYDKDGEYLAVFYADFFPRKGKQGGAWMTEYQGQYINREGKNIRPHVSVVMNFTKSTPEKPALLTLGEVETFLHEFGHSLHGIFASTRYASMSGTRVFWDFVELPSQFMENYAIEPEFLRTFAVHYETGEPLPDELIERIHKSRNYMVATGCLRQVSFGLLDMAYYTLSEPFNAELLSFEKQAWSKAILGNQLPNTCMTTQFSHIMSGGYAAGYYSYKWAEVLDADAFAVFKREGIFNPATAQRFRDCILSKGGTEHPMTLYKNFKGGEPTVDALLERNGIK